MKLILFVVSIILISAVVFFFYPVIRAEYDLFMLNNNNFKMQIVPIEKKARQLTPIDSQFGVVINKIAVNARVIASSNSDNNSLQFALANGLVHLVGSALPGDRGNMVIISQVPGDWYKYTRVNPEFYLIYKLVPKDVIQIYYNGDRFDYSVVSNVKVDDAQLKDYLLQSDQKLLTLVSGWPPGTMLSRLVIQAKLVESQ